MIETIIDSKQCTGCNNSSSYATVEDSHWILSFLSMIFNCANVGISSIIQIQIPFT